MKNLKLLAGLSLLLLALGMTSPVQAESNTAKEKQIPIYRLYNKNSGEHFYTPSAPELINLQYAGWTSEGVGWYAPATGDPVYRIYNPNAKGGDHYYTKNKAEADYNVSLGWKWDNAGKPAFYSGGDVADWVAYNPNAESGAHNYTTNRWEQENLLRLGWLYDAKAWQVLKEGTSKMNADEIVSGDTSSIQGLWKNDEGKTLQIYGDKLILNGRDINDGTVINIWDRVVKGSYGTVTFPVNYEVAGFAVVIAPAWVRLGADDKSDSSRDRVVIGQDLGASSEHTFYRV
jgi:hypothetical protein